MIHSFPNYYKEFSCIADKCEATCCAGWQIVVDDWEETLSQTERILYGPGAAEYRRMKADFIIWKEEQFQDWDIMLEQLLVYFIYTYFCGAVYDEYVASKVKMSVCSVFYIEELARAQWVGNRGKLALTEFTKIVYRSSRELEHSDDNLCTMDKMMEEI